MERKSKRREKTQLTLKRSKKKKQNNTYQHTQVPSRKLWHDNKHVWDPQLRGKATLPYPYVCALRKHNLKHNPTTYRVSSYERSKKAKYPSKQNANLRQVLIKAKRPSRQSAQTKRNSQRKIKRRLCMLCGLEKIPKRYHSLK